MQDDYTDNVSDAVKPGETVKVRVMSVTDGKVALSMKSKQPAGEGRQGRGERFEGGRPEGANGVNPDGGDAGGRARRQGKVATSAGAHVPVPSCMQRRHQQQQSSLAAESRLASAVHRRRL